MYLGDILRIWRSAGSIWCHRTNEFEENTRVAETFKSTSLLVVHSEENTVAETFKSTSVFVVHNEEDTRVAETFKTTNLFVVYNGEKTVAETFKTTSLFVVHSEEDTVAETFKSTRLFVAHRYKFSLFTLLSPCTAECIRDDDCQWRLHWLMFACKILLYLPITW